MSAVRECSNPRMSKARNERMTLERQIHTLEGKDIPTFFPAIRLSDISPFRTLVTFRHYAGRR
jgi:hypothetical protein